MNTSWIRQQHLEYDRFFTKYIFVKKLSFYKYIYSIKKQLSYRTIFLHNSNNSKTVKECQPDLYTLTLSIFFLIQSNDALRTPARIIIGSYNRLIRVALTWEQALFSFRFVNNILAGIAKRKETVAVRENVGEPLNLGLFSG